MELNMNSLERDAFSHTVFLQLVVCKLLVYSMWLHLFKLLCTTVLWLMMCATYGLLLPCFEIGRVWHKFFEEPSFTATQSGDVFLTMVSLPLSSHLWHRMIPLSWHEILGRIDWFFLEWPCSTSTFSWKHGMCSCFCWRLFPLEIVDCYVFYWIMYFVDAASRLNQI